VQSRHDEIVPGKIALRRRRRSDTYRPVRKPDVKAVPVRRRVYRHGLHAHFPAGTDDADRYFAPIGYEQTLYHIFPLFFPFFLIFFLKLEN
jgi:hypothetical protein